jgi:hypothetical protein
MIPNAIGAAPLHPSPPSIVIKSNHLPIGVVVICLAIASIFDLSEITILQPTGFHHDLSDIVFTKSKNPDSSHLL